MPSVDMVDETFIAVPPAVLAAELASPDRWRAWWPDLDLEVATDRGHKGVRWTVRGALVGSMEVWLEPVLDGTVLHYFLRADPPGRDGTPEPLPARKGAAVARARQRAAKTIAFALKSRLEAGRAPGEPPPQPDRRDDPGGNHRG
ncbi:MAG: polyketide cyclase / dehydrase and lipid transport [Pseudonocardia sp.]|nr:polyketide cyclase / dehydrase and lipid transport [Pseudonocardia sp.]